MTYFDEAFNQFWVELAFNNNKTWFDENRKRYQDDVKKPWDRFVLDLAEATRALTPIDDLQPGKFSSRINRDIRFSNDKTPYNTHMWAVMAEHGKKTEGPGFYVHVGLDGLHIAGGYHMPSKEHLTSVRRHIMKNPKALPGILNSKCYKDYWGNELRDKKNKILPPEFKEAAQQTPELFYKGWTYYREYPVDDITRDDLIDFIIEHYKAGQPLNAFIEDALRQ